MKIYLPHPWKGDNVDVSESRSGTSSLIRVYDGRWPAGDSRQGVPRLQADAKLIACLEEMK